MKKILTISSLAVLLVMGATYAITNHQPTTAASQESNVKLPELAMPGVGEGVATNLEFKLDIKAKKPAEQAAVYKFKKQQVNQSKVKDLGGKLGMSGEVKESPTHGLAMQDGDKYLEMEQGSGAILYMDKKNVDKTEVDGRPKSVPDASEAARYATEFLQKMNWLPNEFKMVDVTDNRVIPGNLNPEIDQGTVVSRTVHFYKFVDGKAVSGVSRILVEVGDQGQIEAVRKYHKEQGNPINYPLKSLEQAANDIEKGKGLHKIEEGGQEPVIESAEIVYWEDAGTIDEQPYLQPVYALKGKYRKDGKELPFVGYVSAVQNEYVLQESDTVTKNTVPSEKAGK
jgi:hypothetical protein